MPLNTWETSTEFFRHF